MPATSASGAARVWLITGSARGFGRELVTAALEQGDAVVATARRPDSLASLVDEHDSDRVLTVTLDVTDPVAAGRAVAEAVDRFGRIDVVVNTAGYANSGSIEELPSDDFRAQIETNLFGVVNVTRAALPILRAQRSGLILQFSSIGGRVGGTPGLGAYQAAKFGVEGFSEVLAREVRPFGVHVVIIEPGAFRTDWQGRSMTMYPTGPDYTATVGEMHRRRRSTQGSQPGDPARAARLLADLANRDTLPLRLPLGSDAVDLALANEQRRIDELSAWAALSRCADFPRA